MHALGITGLKHWFFENHWLVSFLALLGACAVIAALGAWNLLYPVFGAVLGLSYFALKQHLEEVRLFKDLFQSFNSRYDAMNERLYMLLNVPTDQPLTDAETLLLYDYFNLCAEEYLYYRKGFVYKEVWSAWLYGMKVFYANPRIKLLWDRELQTNSYYEFSSAMLR